MCCNTCGEQSVETARRFILTWFVAPTICQLRKQHWHHHNYTEKLWIYNTITLSLFNVCLIKCLFDTDVQKDWHTHLWRQSLLGIHGDEQDTFSYYLTVDQQSTGLVLHLRCWAVATAVMQHTEQFTGDDGWPLMKQKNFWSRGPSC